MFGDDDVPTGSQLQETAQFPLISFFFYAATTSLNFPLSHIWPSLCPCALAPPLVKYQQATFRSTRPCKATLVYKLTVLVKISSSNGSTLWGRFFYIPALVEDLKSHHENESCTAVTKGKKLGMAVNTAAALVVRLIRSGLMPVSQHLDCQR